MRSNHVRMYSAHRTYSIRIPYFVQNFGEHDRSLYAQGGKYVDMYGIPLRCNILRMIRLGNWGNKDHNKCMGQIKIAFMLSQATRINGILGLGINIYPYGNQNEFLRSSLPRCAFHICKWNVVYLPCLLACEFIYNQSEWDGFPFHHRNYSIWHEFVWFILIFIFFSIWLLIRIDSL